MPTRHPENAQKASLPSSSPNEGPPLTAPDNTDFWVVCLCADWCHICRDWQHKFDPLVAAHATARAVARIFAALLDGRLLDAATLGEATAPASEGEDVVLGRPSRFGLGFQLTQPERPLGPNPRAFGHFGAGGAVGFADPDAGVAFGYVMNRGGPRWRNPRNQALIAAVYDALEA